MKKPISIIGGGPGGLSAAIRAAELGLRVVLYEKGKIGARWICDPQKSQQFHPLE